MIKVLIVDDEFLVRMGLRTIIDWESLGFEVIGDAENGEKALEMSKKLSPDVVLTDIIMPEMDGLELIRALKEELPQTKVVVLSCYQDFEYVREAMQYLGALDYVPKLSMQSKDLIKVMSNVKSVIEREQDKHRQVKKLERQLSQNIHVMRSKWLHERLVNTEIDKISWLDNKKTLKLNLDDKKDYIAICMCVHGYNKLGEEDDIADDTIMKSSVINVLDGIIQRNRRKGNTFYVTEGEFCIIMNIDTNNHGFCTRDIDDICRQFLNDLKLYLNITASIGISGRTADLFQLNKAYDEAFQACKLRFYRGKDAIVHSKDILPYIEKWYFDGDMVKKLISSLEEGSEPEVLAILNEYFEKVEKNGRILPDVVLGECNEILSIFSSVLKMYGANIYDVNNKDDSGSDPYRALAGCETLDEVIDWYDLFINKYFKCFRKAKHNKYGREISRAIEYINQNYTKELRLRDVAAHIGMNESYLSHVFKKETGHAFTDFVNNRRIKKAKELFRREDMNVQEVSYLVGYTNVSYFSKVFKQIVGVNPNEYKKTKNIH